MKNASNYDIYIISSHGIFGHGVDDSHVGSGGGVNPTGGMGGTTAVSYTHLTLPTILLV